MSLRRHVAWVVAAAVFSAAALPALVFYTGTATLGPYAGGGLREFMADYLADLVRARPGAWTLLLGPVVLVIVWRVIVAVAWPRGPGAVAQPSPEVRTPGPPARRDPTIGGFSRE
jgi:hypothetical protein